MQFTLAILIALFSRNVLSDEGKAKTIIDVDVYYESLCPDSMRFIKSQLIPSYPILKDHLKVNFIPFGKASFEKEGSNDRYNFDCQHGPNECRGNRAQSCGLQVVNEVFGEEQRQERSVNFVGCVMSAYYPPDAIPRCAEEISLDKPAINKIGQCSESLEGDKLLASHGETTLALNPKLSFVPTVVINHVYSKENQTAALRDFRGLICGLLPDDEKPVDCKAAQ